jgi:hypothetical protein
MHGKGGEGTNPYGRRALLYAGRDDVAEASSNFVKEFTRAERTPAAGTGHDGFPLRDQSCVRPGVWVSIQSRILIGFGPGHALERRAL